MLQCTKDIEVAVFGSLEQLRQNAMEKYGLDEDDCEAAMSIGAMYAGIRCVLKHHQCTEGELAALVDHIWYLVDGFRQRHEN